MKLRFTGWLLVLTPATVCAQTTWSDISFAFGGGLKGSTATIPSPYVGQSYTADLSGANVTSTPGTTTWEADFTEAKGQKFTDFQIEIEGSLKATQPNSGTIILSSLDLLDTSLNNSPNVFDLAKNGGGSETAHLSNGNFDLFFPLSGGQFGVTTKGGITQGQISLGNIYEVSNGATLTITNIVIRPTPAPEPSLFLGLAVPGGAFFWRRRRKRS